jgi:hypothetical protein
LVPKNTTGGAGAAEAKFVQWEGRDMAVREAGGDSFAPLDDQLAEM